jgi:hypothetical protein
MKVFSPTALAALASGSIIKRRFILFDFPSGFYGFWDGAGSIVPTGPTVEAPAAGKTFLAGGSVIEIKRGPIGTNGAAPEASLRLRAVPNTDLTPDVLVSLLQDGEYHRRPVYLFLGLFAEDGEIVEIALRDRGFIDSVPYFEDPAAGTAWLEGKMESRLIDWNRGGAHDRNDESQRSTFPDDKGLGNIERASQLKAWGKGVSQ